MAEATAHKRPGSLVTELIRQLTSAICIAAVAASCLFIAVTYVAGKQKQLTTCKADADFLARSLERPLWDIDTATANQICRAYTRREDVVAFILVTANNDTLFQLQKQEHHFIQQTTPVIHDRETIGTIKLVLSNHSVMKTVQQLAFITIIIIGIILLIQWLLLRHLIKSSLAVPLTWLEKIAAAEAYTGELPKELHTPVQEFEPFEAVIRRMGTTINRQLDDLKRLNHELQQSEARVRTICDRSFSFIGLLTPDGTVIETNQTSLDFIGAKPEDVRGKLFWETPWWNHSAATQHQIRGAIADAAAGRQVRTETMHIAKDGTEHIIDFAINQMYDDAGNVLYLIPEGRDITDSRKAHAALIESQALLAAVVNSTSDLICAIDATDFTILMLNTSLETIFKTVKPGNIIGRPFFDLITESRIADWQELISRVLVTGSVTTEFRTTLKSLVLDLTLQVIEQDNKPAIISMFGRDITARVAAEEQLRANRQMLALIINTIPQAIFWKDRSSRYLGCNRVFCRSAGISTPDEIVDKTDFDLPWPRSEAVAYREDDSAVMNNNMPKLHFIEQVQQADGTRIWVDTSKLPLTDDSGDIIGVLGVYDDITERKIMDDKLRLLTTTIDISSDGVYWMDTEGCFTYANDAGCRDLGYTREELLSLKVFDVVPGASAEGWKKLWVQLRENHHYASEVMHRRKDGSTFPVEIVSTYVQFGDKEYVNGFARNITERKKIEHALRESEENFRCTFEQAAVGIAQIAPDGRWLRVNNRLCGILGYSSDELLTMSFADVTLPEDKKRDLDAIRQLLADEITRYSREKRYIRKDGTLVWVNVTVTLLRDQAEAPRYFVAITEDITSRKRAEEALHDSELLYHTLFTNAPVGIFHSTAGGKIIRVNDEYAHMMGYASPDDAKDTINQSTIAEVLYVTSDDRNDILEQVTANPGTWVAAEKQFHKKDGTIITANMMIRSLPDNPGQLEGFLEDITQRKKAEQDLRESEERYRRLLESVTGYVYTVNVHNGKCLSTIHNPGCIVVTGYDAEDYAKNPDLWLSMIPEEDRPGTLEAVNNVMHRREPVSLKHRIIHKNGELRWVSATLVPHSDAHGSIISYDGLITDITGRESAEAALRESEERFRQIAENIEEIFFLFQKDGHRLLYMSPVVGKMFDVDMQELKADPDVINRAVHPDDALRTQFTDLDIFYSQPIDEEFRIITKDESIRWIKMRSFLILDADGTVVRVAGLAADITLQHIAAEKERLHNEQLQQADKMASLGILVSGVAHEVNNPNNFIMLNTPLLQDAWEQAKPILESYRTSHGNFDLGGIPFDEMKEIIPTLFQGIHDGSTRIKRIVEDLKNFARKDNSSYTAIVDVCSVVTEAVSLLSSHIHKKTANFTINLPDAPVRIRGNRQKLEQVVINLIHNACDALEATTRAVNVTVESFATECIITVTDEGRGIPKGDLLHLTEPFFTTKRDIGGTGLGLSVSAGIIKEHNGKLVFESEMGKGTTAKVILPVKLES